MSDRKKISIGCCCYNEAGNVRPTYEALREMMDSLPQYDFEIIFADNASTDGTKDILRELAAQDLRVKVVFNRANFGAYNSGANRLRYVTGNAYITIPCDLQEPIEMIPEFLKYWEQGYDIVWGQKTRSEENAIKYHLRGIYYSIIDKFSDRRQLRQVTGFGVIDRTVLDAFMISKMQDPTLAIRHWAAEYGFRMKLIPYTQRKRVWGKSSFNISKYLDFAITSLCNTSTKPLRFMTITGILTGIGCIFVSLVYLVYKLTHWHSFSLGLAPLIIGLFFCMAIQLFCIGMLGEYVGILLRKVTKKVLVVEEEKLNIDDESDQENTD